MANKEQLKILWQGKRAWDEWTRNNPEEDSDLSAADLSNMYLLGSCFRCANLSGANLCNSTFSFTDLSYADLSGAMLTDTNLNNANLYAANLKNAWLHGADLRYANLSFADLSGATLAEANLMSAELSGAKLDETDLMSSNLSRVSLNDAVINHARIGWTTFSNNDLSTTLGLETVDHQGPSSIDMDTLYQSGGEIPEVFLRGCGLSDDFIAYARSLTAKPIEFYSCFISYSSKDQEFAGRLHADLQSKGVRVWFAPHDMPIGARIRPTIDASIRVYDKLLLVLSAASVSSQWVEQEVETALRKERQGSGTVLFPVRLDDSVLEAGEGWPALIKDTRHVGDFTDWKGHDSYRKAFDRLLRDLKAEGQPQ